MRYRHRTVMYAIFRKASLELTWKMILSRSISPYAVRGIACGASQGRKKADKIYLATDPDREGEAISWHLMQALKENPQKMHRISFNEITKTAVKASIKQARDLDMDLVDAQQARRMLDRMVGYSISPLLWAKVKRGLSAGRVQSVALRIICDREEEINSFIPEEYWSLEGTFRAAGEKKAIQAKFYGTDKKFPIHNKKEMDELLERLKDQEYKVTEVKKGSVEKMRRFRLQPVPCSRRLRKP